MKKPTLLQAAVATIVALCIASYYFLTFPSVYDAIPSSGVAVLQVNNWTQFSSKLSTSYTGMELKKTSLVQKLLNEVTEIQDLLDNKVKAEWQFNSGKTVASVHLISADDYDFLFTSSISGLSEKDLLKDIQSGKQVRSVRERVFKGHNVLDITLTDGKILTAVKIKGILAISFTSFLVENSIKAVSSGDNIEDDKAFCSVRRKFVPSGDLSLFFNFKKADVILPIAFNDKKIELLGDLNQFADWGAYNLTLSNQGMELKGIAYSSDHESNSTPAQNMLKHPLLSVIPDNAASLTSAIIQKNHSDDPEYLKNFNPWIGGAQALFVLESLEEDFNNQGVLLLQIRNEQQAKKYLTQLGAEKVEPESMYDSLPRQEIFYLKDATFLNRYFGNSLINWNDGYFFVSKGAVMFSGSVNTLTFVLDKIEKGETLIQNQQFAALGKQFAERADKIAYMNPARSEMLLQGLVKKKTSLKSYLLQFGEMMVSSTVQDEWISSIGIFQVGSEKKRTSPGVLWRTALQTLSDFPPQIVLNVNTQEKELITQDSAGNIYLLNKSGEILFTKNIGEPVLGSIQQLDYYNNGKLQYIFNSAHYVFMIDRFGNDVASYPLKLSSPATAGLTLVYNPASKSYQYYIPCDNQGVYGYESTGRPLGGWSPRASVGTCNKPLQHIRQKEEDYFLAFTQDGKLLLMNDKGKWMWGLANLPVTEQNYSVVPQRSGFVLLNASGKELTEISFDGNDRIKPLIGEANHFVATATSDTSYLYFFSNKNELRSYDGKGAFKKSAYLKDANIFSLEVAYIAAEKHLLVKDQTASKIFIYDLSLELEGEFVAANISSVTIADLLDRNEFIAIAADRKGNLSCTRIR